MESPDTPGRFTFGVSAGAINNLYQRYANLPYTAGATGKDSRRILHKLRQDVNKLFKDSIALMIDYGAPTSSVPGGCGDFKAAAHGAGLTSNELFEGSIEYLANFVYGDTGNTPGLAESLASGFERTNYFKEVLSDQLPDLADDFVHGISAIFDLDAPIGEGDE